MPAIKISYMLQKHKKAITRGTSMSDKPKDESQNRKTSLKDTQVGVMGDHARIDGGIHFHYHGQEDDTGSAEHPERLPTDSTFDAAKAANIIHLSDLHFGADKQSDPIADAKRWYGQLTDDLCEELECEQLHAAIISGDIGNFSLPEEYQAAELFLEQLCAKFRLEASKLIIVPGNHDLNWKLSKKGYRLMDVEDHDGPLKDGHFIQVDEDVIRLRDDETYPLRFQHFDQFHATVTGRPYPLATKDQADLHFLPELNLVIVGFNSVWEADHHFKLRISINPDAVAAALDQIRERSGLKNYLKLAVWHHSLSSQEEDRIKDYGFM